MREKLEIIMDTREQTPWHFPADMCNVTRLKIDAGDYCLKGDDSFAIERKSLDDFIGTIFSGWERFKRELDRMTMAKFPARIVIVESSIDKIFFHIDKMGVITEPNHNHPSVTPQGVVSRIAELSLMGVSVIFADNANFSVALALHIFQQRKKQLEK